MHGYVVYYIFYIRCSHTCNRTMTQVHTRHLYESYTSLTVFLLSRGTVDTSDMSLFRSRWHLQQHLVQD